MLSYIYQIAYYFERNHGYRPNTLYVNKAQFSRLRQEFVDADDIDAIIHYLSMNILISDELLHPHVAYLERRQATIRETHSERSQRMAEMHHLQKN